MTNVLVEPAPDGFAVSAYFEAVSVVAGAARIVLGEYRDRLRTVDGDLRIAEKNIDVQRTFRLPAWRS